MSSNAQAAASTIDPLSEPMIDIHAAAKILGLKSETVEKLARAGHLPHYRVGGPRGVVRFSPPELREHLASRRVPGERAAS